MNKKSSKDVLKLINRFQTLIKNRPSVMKMFEEIRMMKFKIKPIRGDLSRVDLRNEKFIETLWNLGKLDEFYFDEYEKLNQKNKQIFLKIFDDLYHKYQDELNHINIFQGSPGDRDKSLEIEIYKENKSPNKIN